MSVNISAAAVESQHFVGRWTHDLLMQIGVSEAWASFTNLLVLIAIVAILIYLGKIITQFIIEKIILRLGRRATKLTFFSYLSKNRLPHYLSLIVPYSIIKMTIPFIFYDYPGWVVPMDRLADVYLIYTIIRSLMAVIASGFDVLQEQPSFKDKPIKSYLQVILIILSIFGIVIAISILTGKSLVAVLATMGAASAVLMLMFQSTIMGFVASVQVTTNDMVRLGDWIEMPKYGADGDVIDIALTTVKVQNFDKTITTIPTSALISDSFQNWRGMVDSGGRRIKRSISIKQSSIRYIREDEIAELKKISGIADYIDRRQKEIEQYNISSGVDRSIPINGRNLTNAGLFREYSAWYLSKHPGTAKDMTLMVRQLAPTEKGLPIELYVFANTTKWADYEGTMADIFDHLIAAVGYFDLQIFEFEGEGDLKRVSVKNSYPPPFSIK